MVDRSTNLLPLLAVVPVDALPQLPGLEALIDLALLGDAARLDGVSFCFVKGRQVLK